MTYLWVIPVVLLILIAVLIFYAVIRTKGGPGVRTPGKTVVDKTAHEPPPPGPQHPSES